MTEDCPGPDIFPQCSGLECFIADQINGQDLLVFLHEVFDRPTQLARLAKKATLQRSERIRFISEIRSVCLLPIPSHD
jgi:hypothetical protein